MSAGNGSGPVVPAAYPPPVDARHEFIKRGLDPDDELIEVGVAIVGGGTAGLACANRLLQLLADDPETLERLGEVPVAVIEKAKTCGGHNLSGAVMRPGPLQELFPEMTREQWREAGFAFGEVKKEAVYLLPSAKTKVRIPTPPPFKNHGNEVISVSALARYQQEQAEEAGAYVLTETAASQLIVDDGRVVGVRSGDKGRGKDGEPLSNFEPGTDIKAHATVLAEGCWGHLTGAAIQEFGLGEGREPTVWELGVKEVWKVPEPLETLIHTIGPWPLKISAKYGQIGGTWIYPMHDAKSGENLVSIGFVVDLEYADATTSAHDLLQLFKTHPLVRSILEGGERVAWGAKALPGGGWWSMPKLTTPGALLVGDAAGMVDTVALKGVHHCLMSGKLAAESIYAALVRGESNFEAYEAAIEDSSVGKELYTVRNTRQPFQKGFLRGGPMVNLMIATKGRFPGGAGPGTATTPSPYSSAIPARSTPSPTASTRSTSSPPSTSAETRRATTPRTTFACSATFLASSPRPGVGCAPPACTRYPTTPRATGDVDVIVNYTNCVQCGAITAKGGRLTTPEGGDGPLYQIT